MILNQEVAPLEVKIIYFFYISLSISPEKNPGHNMLILQNILQVHR